MKPINLIFITVVVILSGLLILSVMTKGYSILTGSVTGYITAEGAGQRVIDYLNKEVLQGATATLVDVEEVSDVYKINVNIQGETYPLYVSKDGKLMFLQAVEIKFKEPFNVPASQKPVVKFFVMSFCPYGQQTESLLAELANLFGDKVEFEPHYVIYENYMDNSEDYCTGTLCSMHGINELKEDMRQICIYNNYPEKFWDYIEYVNSKCSLDNINDCWKNAAGSLEIDIQEVEDCADDINLIQNEKDLNAQFGVVGSPTIFINDMKYEGSRSLEAIKNTICNAFITPPAECQQELTSNPSGTTRGGSCS